jgi:hypothetical protein
MRRFGILFLLFFFLSGSGLFAQQIEIEKDSTSVSKIFHSRKHPVISVNFSNEQFGFNGFISPVKFKKSGTVEISLGYKTYSKNHPAKKYFSKYISLAYSSNKLTNQSSQGLAVGLEFWRLAAVSETGYRYNLGPLGFSPYAASGYFLYNFSFAFNTVCPVEYGIVCPTVNPQMSRFSDGTHFGKIFEEGLSLGLGEKLSLKFGYSESLFTPRFMTWHFLGSEILYGLARVALDKFNRTIIQDSPVLGGFIDVALVSGLNYLVYHFQKDEMNWPIKSETPIFSEGFRAGLTLTF